MAARILVVEDNPENLDLMVYLLKAHGHQALKASDGEEGLKALRQEAPDAILCDLQMPKLDGYEFAQQVKRDPQLSKIPLVAVTAYAMVGDRDKVLAAGFDGYISKPIVPEAFVSQVERFLLPGKRSTSQPSAFTQSSDAGKPAPTPHGATLLVVDNSPVNLSLMRSTLEPFGYKVIGVGTVDEALAFARQDPPDLILSDLHMPGEGGYDFLKILKADAKLSAIPFLLISSTVWRETDPNVALALGATKFIFRPIEPHALAAEIEACLEERREG